MANINPRKEILIKVKTLANEADLMSTQMSANYNELDFDDAGNAHNLMQKIITLIDDLGYELRNNKFEAF